MSTPYPNHGDFFCPFFSFTYSHLSSMSQIELQDVLELMESGAPFSLVAVKYDRNRSTGGDFMKFTNAILVGKQSTTGVLKLKTNTGEVRAIHQRLITQFNNKDVIW